MEADDSILNKYTVHKEVFYRFSIAFTKVASIGAIPTLLNQVILGIYFVSNDQLDKTFNF